MTSSTLVQQLRKQVLRCPDRVAVVSDNDTLTFADLWQRSGQVAAHLRNHGVRSDTIIGVFIDSSIELEIAIWAVLRAGGAYLPLSPEYPHSRLRYTVEDSGAQVILTSKSLVSDARTIMANNNSIIALDEALYGKDNGEHDDLVKPKDLAYVIYTSGSTGRPKGVAISHESITHQLSWLRAEMGIDDTVRILQKTPFSFDAAQWEILALAQGATVIMAGVDSYRDPDRLIETAKKQGVNTLQCVPTLWAALLESEGFGELSLSKIFSGGEALTSILARDLSKAHSTARLVNLYGPTETTINASAYVVNKDDLDESDRVLPIGYPVYGTELIVSDGITEVSDGDIGELYITGPQLARGYIGNDELTDAKFVTIPDANGLSRRAYRTGDLVIKAADGCLSFIGRVDNQVKINGHRIELDEIRLAIENHRWIRRATVVPWQSRLGTAQLAAFVELDETEAALMDAKVAGNHHRSKSNRRQVRAQLSNSAFRALDGFGGVTLQLPFREASEEVTKRAFARKTYRNFRSNVRSDQVLHAINQAKEDLGFQTPGTVTFDTALLGKLLRWFGPFLSDARLLPKYAYASPGALNASQIFLEVNGVDGLSPGLYYFHPLEHALTLVSMSTAVSEGIRFHLYGKRSRIKEVYSTNVDEVLYLEAGHMLGLLEEIVTENSLYLVKTTPPHELPPNLFEADDFLHTLSVELSRQPSNEMGGESVILAQFHEETPDGLSPGTYRVEAGNLERIGEPVIRRKDVIAINQAVYDRSTFGVALVVSKLAGWAGFVELGRLLHRLQTSSAAIGLMASGYSSLSGFEMATSSRLDELVGKDFSPHAGTLSYFALGGGVSAEQRLSRGMDEDLVHMRGPAEILKDDLRELLPEYMVPGRVRVVEATPTTPSGKIDLQALRDLIEAEEKARPLVLPSSQAEKEIANIWRDILRLSDEELSIRDSFFDAGGNSLSAMALVNRLNNRFGTRMPIQALFAAPTIEALAREVSRGSSSVGSRLVRLDDVQGGRPIYCWPGLGGYPMGLRPLAQAGNASLSFVGVQAHGINSGEVPFSTIQEMAAADVELIQRNHPEGRIICAGYSFGARVAFETTFQLEQLGRTVEQLVLIAPGSPLQKSTTAVTCLNRFEDKRFLRILLSVFAGTLNSPIEAELLTSIRDERSFIDFVVERFDGLSIDLVARIIAVVKATFSFEYTFDEISQRAVKAPITLIKAKGDDYSFLENMSAQGSTCFSRIIELPNDHYSILRGDGQTALVEVLRDLLSSDQEISMPHINVKHFPAQIDEGRRQALADELASAVVKAFGCAPNVVSVALEPVEEANWDAQVYQPEIVGRKEYLVKEARYGLQRSVE